MSQKKHKKRHPQQKRNAASAPAMESEFASDGRRKRMNRTSRNLLLLSLVLVAAVNLLVNMGMMGQAMANVLSLVGIILLDRNCAAEEDPGGRWDLSPFILAFLGKIGYDNVC